MAHENVEKCDVSDELPEMLELLYTTKRIDVTS